VKESGWRVVLRVNFIYGYCRRREKVKKESDGNIVRKGGSEKKNGDNCIGVLTRDDDPDFGQIETVRTNEIRVRRKGSDAMRGPTY